MPISEDELEHGYGSHAHSYMHHGNETMSKAEQRRSNKPIMEKRRRARINHCLNELKALILDAMKKDPARHSKLEKADILEMTVKHLQTIQRQQLSLAVGADPSVVHKFHTGFSECAGEVSRYVARMDNVEAGVRQRLVSHLASCVSGLQQMAPLGSTSSSTSQNQNQVGSPEDVNNNTSASARLQMMSGLQLIPSRLPSGELALLLPNSQHLPFFPTALENQVSTTTESSATSVDRSRNSAFTAVSRDKSAPSPLASPTSTTTSSYGDESCDQPYPSPSHPPEVTSTSEHPRGIIEKGFTTYQPTKNEPQGLLQISLPNQEFPRLHPSTHKTVKTPLTVITSNSILKEPPPRFVDVSSQPVNIKDPLDFSVKKDSFSNPFLPLKRPYREEVPDNLLVKSTDYQPSLKMPKVVTEARSETCPVPERRSLFEIQNQPHTLVESRPQTLLVPDRSHSFESHNQPSTSSNEGNRDMWRPW